MNPTGGWTQPANFGIERAKTEIAGREVKLLIVKRVVGNVHLAVESAQRAIGIERCRCIVVEAGGALFEQRSNQDHSMLAGRGGDLLVRRSGNRFCQLQERV